MTTEEREYVLGTDDGELQRLGFQLRVWSAPAFALWERAGVHVGASVLDVGCGPGCGRLRGRLLPLGAVLRAGPGGGDLARDRGIAPRRPVRDPGLIPLRRR